MNFSINYLAVIVAAAAGVAINALWYTVIFKRQIDVLRAGDLTIAGRDPEPQMYAVAIGGQLLMAFVLGVIMRTMGIASAGGGVLAGLLVGIGLLLPPIAQVQTFGYRRRMFILVDGGLWLVNAIVMSVILAVWT